MLSALKENWLDGAHHTSEPTRQGSRHVDVQRINPNIRDRSQRALGDSRQGRCVCRSKGDRSDGVAHRATLPRHNGAYMRLGKETDRTEDSVRIGDIGIKLRLVATRVSIWSVGIRKVDPRTIRIPRSARGTERWHSLKYFYPSFIGRGSKRSVGRACDWRPSPITDLPAISLPP